MPEQKQKQKRPLTPRQQEIARLSKKGAANRSDQESARLDQLKKEERRDRFQRLAVKRVQGALKALSNVAACGNRSSYDYSQEEANRIIVALEEATDKVRSAYSERKNEPTLFAL